MSDIDALRRRPEGWFDAYLFDLDGTVYLGDELLPGARDLLDELRDRGARRVFLSNNPTRDPEMYLDKLTRLGIAVEPAEIVNTVVSTVGWLHAQHPGAVVYPIAEAPLVRALAAAGIQMSDDPAQIDIVIASYDRSFDYRKLQTAFDALWQHGRAILITTNPDRYCPFPGGRGEPDAAGIVAALEATTGVRCSANMGKPGRIMIDAVRGMLGPEVERVVMVGDRLETDVRMGIEAGIGTALVLTGDSQLADVDRCDPGLRPQFILDRIDELVPVPALARPQIAP
ncbi:HAD-IIA family hydrolase [Microbacterium sp. NPDC055910]|uniref:HAD-IIA family hydrolase n=1 Tax=Microbacterium sp. NPDC055910 TaxID=3345659 RepID=UPI0035DA3E03